MLYLKVAIEIDTGAHHKIVVIGAPENEPETDPDETLGYWPKPDVIARIVPRLAEVPQEQAQFYFEQVMQGTFNVENLPMPLKHKLRLLAKEDFSMEDIEWVLSRIASFGNAPIPHYPAEEKAVKVTDTPKFRLGVDKSLDLCYNWAKQLNISGVGSCERVGQDRRERSLRKY